MNNKTNTCQKAMAIISRTLLGLTFVFSGVVKAIDPLGTVYKIEDYLKAFGGIFTSLIPAAQVAAIVLISVEFVLGVCLLTNVKTSITSVLTLLFYLVMTPLTLYVALTNPVSDCGCFGDALVISNWATFGKNMVLMVLVVVLLLTRNALKTTFKPMVEWVIIVLSTVLVGAFMWYTLLHLPIKDFRPYKVGNHIPTLMEIPEDAPVDVYDIRFIYEKDGQQQEFTLDNYPKGDSTWTFVDQRSILVSKGYEPPIHDFEILNAEYEDITYDILESTSPVTLVIMYDLAKADIKQMQKVNELFVACLKRQTPFYILTGSGEADVEELCRRVDDGMNNMLTPFNHPEMVFCTCDPVTLKTIVRANPGVIVVQNGTITEKYNLRNHH